MKKNTIAALVVTEDLILRFISKNLHTPNTVGWQGPPEVSQRLTSLARLDTLDF